MFTYDAYKNRIKKIAALKHFIARFKVPIIIALTLIIGSLTAFLCTKGMVTSAVMVTDNIVYGDTYEVGGAKAFLSDIKAYEFALEGSDKWTENKPIYAGRYRVRAVAGGVFGKRYGDETKFEILPKAAEFSVFDDTVIYGNKPSHTEIKISEDGFEANKLLYSDRLDKNALDYDYADLTVKNTSVIVKKDSVRITNAAGDDVSHCYVISSLPHDVTITPRKITVGAQYRENEYNGSAQEFANEASDYTKRDMADGDSVSFTSEVTDLFGRELAPKNAGEYNVSVNAESVKFYKNGVDVTQHYEISVSDTSVCFVIKRKELIIETLSESREYNALPLQSREFTHSGEVAGHKVEIAPESFASITDAGSAVNRLEFLIKDENGEDVTNNYIKNVSYGTLTVQRRKVSVSTASNVTPWEYDGLPHSLAEYDITKGSLVQGHNFAVASYAEVTSAESKDNAISLSVFCKGADVSANYDISYTYGTLTVGKRRINIVTATNTELAEYDGAGHGYENYEITLGSIAAGQSVKVTYTQIIYEVTDFADNVLKFDVTDGENSSVASNYDINVIYGKIALTPRRIEIDAGSINVVYDGKNHESIGVETARHLDKSGAVTDDYGFIPGHKATVEDIDKIITVNKVSDSGTRNYYAPEDYKITDLSGGDVSRNYEIVRVIAGTLNITARSITVITADAEKTYDAQPLSTDKAAAYNLADGHSIKAKDGAVKEITECAQSNVGNNTTEFIVLDESGADVTENYDIAYAYGSLTVNRRDIIITNNSEEKTYDGIPLSNGGFTENGGLLPGQTIKRINTLNEITDVGTAFNEGAFIIKQGEKDVTANYNITAVSGVLTVTERPISLVAKDYTVMYDGEYHFSKDFDYKAGSLRLVSGHEFEVVGYGESKDADEYEIDLSFAVYEEKDGVRTDKTRNYKITLKKGTLTILKRPIMIETVTDTFVYDGLNHDGKEKNPLGCEILPVISQDEQYLDIVSGHSLNIETVKVNDVMFTDSGEISYKINGLVSSDAYTITDAGGFDVTRNYSVKFIYGKLTVMPRPLTVTTASDSKEYDGTPLKNTDYTPKNLATGHAIGVDASKPIAEITNVGSVLNEMSFFIHDNTGKDLIRNYDITYEYGTLTVTKRKLYVKVCSDSFEYDGNAHYNDSAEFFHADEYGNKTDGFGLVQGHIYLAVSARREVINTWDDVINTYIYEFKSGNTDVTGNYDCVYTEDGVLSVTARGIRITLLSVEREYNGEILYGDKFSAKHFANGLEDNNFVTVDGHSIVAIKDTVTQIKEVNESPAKVLTEFTVVSDYEERIHLNYKIYYVRTGYLKITPRNIQITTLSAEKEYDNNPLFAYGYEKAEHIKSGKPDAASALIGDNTLVLTENSKVQITHVLQSSGRDYGVYNTLRFNVYSGEKDVSYNYAISYIDGTLTVTPKPVDIHRGSYQKEYDDEYIDKVPAVVGIIPELYANQELRYIADSMLNLRDVGEIDNTARYNVIDLSCPDFNGGDVTDDYAITYIKGTLKITAKALHVTTGSGIWEYDGEPHWIGSKSAEGLIGGHRTVPDTSTVKYITDKGSITNDAEYFVYADDANESSGYRDVTSNYNITYTYGTLTVTARNIRIYTASRTWEYDGKPHSDSTGRAVHLAVDENGNYYEDENFALAANHETIAKSGIVEVADVWEGKIENRYSYKIILPDGIWDDGDLGVWDDNATVLGNDMSHNYNIVSVVYGIIEITPRKILITRLSDEKIYDGIALLGVKYNAAHFNAVTNTTDGEPVLVLPGHSINPKSSTITRIIYVKESGAIIDTEYTVYEDMEESRNYEILYSDTVATLTILPRPITVTSASAVREYNGKPLSDLTFDVSGMGVVNNDEQNIHHVAVLSDKQEHVEKYAAVTDVGKQENVLYIYVDDGHGNDVTENYKITYVYGEIRVTERIILVSAFSDRITYNGKPYEYASGYGNFEYTTSNELRQVVVGEQLEISVGFYNDDLLNYVEPKNAGMYQIHICGYVTADGKQNYIVVNDASSNLVIIRRTVHILPVVEDFVYNGEVYEHSGAWKYSNEEVADDNKILDEDFCVTLEYRDKDWNVVLPKNAGDYLAVITGYTTGDGEQNYYIAGGAVNSPFTILRREVKNLTPQSVSVVYNKQPVTVTDYVTDGITDTDKPHIEVTYGYYEKLGEDTFARLTSAPVNAGTYYAKVVNVFAENNLLDNYILDAAYYGYAEIIINKAEITVKPAGGSMPYNGETVTYSTVTELAGKKYEVIEGTLYGGDILTVSAKFDGTVIYADGSTQTVNGPEITEAGIYEVLLTASNPNYNVTVSGDTVYFEIKKLEITVTTFSGEFTYTGSRIVIESADGATVSDSVAALMHKLGHEIKEEGGIIINNIYDAGEYVNDCTVKVFAGEKEVSHNYAIIADYGTITVKPKTVTVGINLMSQIKEYDGEPFELTYKDTVCYGFVLEHKLSSAVWQELINAGTYSRYVMTEYEITDSNGNRFSSYDSSKLLKNNYKIEYEVVPVTIEKRALHYNLNLQPREYNGAEQYIQPGEIIADTERILEKDRNVTIFAAAVKDGKTVSITDAGEYAVTITDLFVGGVSVKSANSNYSFAVADGDIAFYLQIAKYSLAAHGVKVKVNDSSRGYTGEPLYGKDGDIVSENLLDGYGFFGLDWAVSVTDPGDTAVNRPEGFAIKKNGEDFTFNFDFEGFDNIEYGMLSVTGEVVLKPDKDEDNDEYDGTIKFESVNGRIENSSVLTFTADITRLLRNGADDTQIKHAGNYAVYYDNVKYFLNGNPLNETIAAKLQITNDKLLNYSVTKRVVYVMPDASVINTVYSGSSQIDVSGYTVQMFGQVAGDGFVPTEVTWAMDGLPARKFTANSGGLYVEVPFYNYANVKFVYSGGQMRNEKGEDITDNYDVVYLDNDSYKSNYDKLIELGCGNSLTSASFKVRVNFEKIAVTVNVNRLPDGISATYPYIGEDRDLGITDTGFFTVSGLYSEHISAVEKTVLSSSVGEKGNWFKLKVIDENGNTVTKLYDIEYVYASDAVITVTKAKVEILESSVKVNGVYLEEFDMTDVFIKDNGIFEGETIVNLNGDYKYYKLTGAANHYIRVNKNGGGYITFKITETGNAKQDYLTKYYTVTA